MDSETHYTQFSEILQTYKNNICHVLCRYCNSDFEPLRKAEKRPAKEPMAYRWTHERHIGKQHKYWLMSMTQDYGEILLEAEEG